MVLKKVDGRYVRAEVADKEISLEAKIFYSNILRWLDENDITKVSKDDDGKYVEELKKIGVVEQLVSFEKTMLIRVLHRRYTWLETAHWIANNHSEFVKMFEKEKRTGGSVTETHLHLLDILGGAEANEPFVRSSVSEIAKEILGYGE